MNPIITHNKREIRLHKNLDTTGIVYNNGSYGSLYNGEKMISTAMAILTDAFCLWTSYTVQLYLMPSTTGSRVCSTQFSWAARSRWDSVRAIIILCDAKRRHGICVHSHTDFAETLRRRSWQCSQIPTNFQQKCAPEKHADTHTGASCVGNWRITFCPGLTYNIVKALRFVCLCVKSSDRRVSCELYAFCGIYSDYHCIYTNRFTSHVIDWRIYT